MIKKYEFTEEQINAILGYLAQKPYAEVQQLIQMIFNAAKAQNEAQNVTQ